MALEIFENKKDTINSFGIVGTYTNLFDDVGAPLRVGDVVFVVHKSRKWSRISLVCQKDDFYIPSLPHIRDEDRKQFFCVKIMDYSRLTDGFVLGSFVVKDQDGVILNKKITSE